MIIEEYVREYQKNSVRNDLSIYGNTRNTVTLILLRLAYIKDSARNFNVVRENIKERKSLKRYNIRKYDVRIV